MTRLYLTLAGHLSAMGMVAGMWALVNVTANTKYVCGTTNDSYVTTARWLDTGHFITAFAITCLVLYRQMRTESDKPDAQFAVLVEVFGGLSALIFLTTVITTASVCSNNKCLTSEAASDAIHNIETDVFRRQVDHMIGNTVEHTATWPCNGRLDPFYFQAPNSYCETAIDGECGTIATVVTTERCLVYACSNLVPGQVSRYTISMICIILQILAAVLLIMYERALHVASAGGDYSAAAEQPSLELAERTWPEMVPKELQIRKRRPAKSFYSSPKPNINF